jgi:thiol-disulfide isomerase/thioredoxin
MIKRNKKIKKVIGIGIILFFLVVGSVRSASASSIDFTFYTPQGKRYSLSQFRGKYVLVNLFASYCDYCTVELGIFNKIAQTCNSRELKIIAIMIDNENSFLLPKIVSARKLSYIIGLSTSEVFKAFSDFNRITPTTYFINKKGEKIQKFIGYKTYEEWLQILKKYVKCN